MEPFGIQNFKWDKAKKVKKLKQSCQKNKHGVSYFEVKWVDPWEANFFAMSTLLFSVELIFRPKIARPTFGIICAKLAQPFFGNQNKGFFNTTSSPPQEVNLRRKGREEYAQGRLRFKKHNSLLFLVCWLLFLAFYLAV